MYTVRGDSCLHDRLPMSSVPGDRDDEAIEDDDELRDEARPLACDWRPVSDKHEDDEAAAVESERPPCDAETTSSVTRRFAKDKRKLREKRRSTGVVRYNCPTHVQKCPVDHDVDDDEVGGSDETGKNTTFNETLCTSGTDANCTTDDQHNQTSSPTSQTSTSVPDSSQPSTSAVIPAVTEEFAGSLAVSSARLSSTRPGLGPTTNCLGHGSPADGHRKTAPPAVPCKPDKLRSRREATDSASGQRRPVSDEPSTCWRVDEHASLVAKLHSLEKLVNEGRMENFRLKELLQVRADRVVELEAEVHALNRDLDLADEDYVKLEAENRALVRVVAQLSSR